MTNGPSFTNLFGAQDYCTKTSYTSPLAPATYLNEILAALQKNITLTSPSESFALRRPDVSQIIANKENTEGLVDKVKLVNKVLVNYLSPSAVTWNSSEPFDLQYESVINEANKYLKAANYPLNVPYSHAIGCITKGLDQFDTSLINFYQEMEVSYNNAVPELLGINANQWGIINGKSLPAVNPLVTLYGFDKSSTVKTDAVAVTTLAAVDLFLQKTGLNMAGLQDLLYGDLSETEITDNLNRYFYINLSGEYLPSISLSQDGKTLNYLTEIRLERINRFLRLQQYLSWSAAELNFVLLVVNNLNFFAQDGLSTDILPLLVWLKYYKDKTELSIDECLALVGYLKYYGNRNGPYLYQKVYNQVGCKVNFADISSKTYIEWDVWGAKATTAKEPSIKIALATALGVTETEIQKMVAIIYPNSVVNKKNSLQLSTNHLAVFYRLSKLPILTGLSISECLLAAELLKITAELIVYDVAQVPPIIDKLVRFCKWLAKQSFSIYELQFMVTRTSNCSSVLNSKVSLDATANIALEIKKMGKQVQLNKLLASAYDISNDMAQLLIENICTIPGVSEEKLLAALLLIDDVSTKPGDSEEKLVATNGALNASPIELLRCLQQGAELIKCVGLSYAEAAYFSTLKKISQPSIFQPNFVTGRYVTLANIQNLVQFKALVRRYSDSGNHLLNFIKDFEANPSMAEDDLATGISAVTQWDTSEIENILTPSDLPQGDAIQWVVALQQRVDYAKQLNLSVMQVQSMLKLNTDTYSSVSEAVTEGLSAAKNSIAKNAKPDEDLRDKLVAQALHKSQLENANDLYGYLLIDVEVSSAVKTSVLREGITAAQLYINRCLNQEESCTVNPDLKQIWSWMYSYRTWYPNEEVFLCPENYMEPTLRPSKSPEFAKLESALKQADLSNKGVAESLFSRYVESVVDLANLNVVGAAIKGEKSNNAGDFSSGELMLVACTQKDPTRYYSRIANLQFSGDNEPILAPSDWDYWQEIDIQMQPASDLVQPSNSSNFIEQNTGVHPLYCMGRWYVGWVEKQQTGSDTQAKPTSQLYSAIIKCSYLQANGHWAAPQKLATFDMKSTTWADVYLYTSDNTYPTGFSFNAKKVTKTLGNGAQGDWTYSNAIEDAENVLVPIPGAAYALEKFPPSDNAFSKNLAKNLRQHWQDNQNSLTLLGQKSCKTTIADLVQTPKDYKINTYTQIQTVFPNVQILSSILHETQGIKNLLGVEMQKNVFIKNNPADGDFSPYKPASALHDYLWEIYFHAPALIASELKSQQQYSDAKTWLEYIFNPSVSAANEGLEQGENPLDEYWSFIGLRSQNSNLLPKGESTVNRSLVSDLASSAEQKIVNLDPYDPHAIANLRPVAYQKYVMQQSYKTLMAWADQLFKENTRSTIAEAELLYVTAQGLLGKKPKEVAVPVTAWSSASSGSYFADTLPSDPAPDGGQESCFGVAGDSLVYYGNDLWIAKPNGNWQSSELPAAIQRQCKYVVSAQSQAYVLQDSQVIQVSQTGELTTIVSPANSTPITGLYYSQEQHTLFGIDGIQEDKTLIIYELNKGVWQTKYSISINVNFNPNSLIVNGETVCLSDGESVGVSKAGGVIAKIIGFPQSASGFASSCAVIDGNLYTIAGKIMLLNGATTLSDTPASFFPPNYTKPSQMTSCSGKLICTFLSSDDGQNLPSIWLRELDGSWLNLDIVYTDPATGEAMTIQDPSNVALNGALLVNETTIGIYIQYKDLLGVNVTAIAHAKLVEVPDNIQIQTDWQTVERRLYNIRHSLTIDGKPDILPLYATPLDPLDLEEAIADGEGVRTAAQNQLNNLDIPAYRFEVMLQKAQSYTSTVIQFGQSLLSALEQKDSEKLAMLYNAHQTDILQMQRTSKHDQLNMAKASIASLGASQSSAQQRHDFYDRMLGDGLSPGEKAQIALSALSIYALEPQLELNIMSVLGYAIPNIFGFSDGGFSPGGMIQQGAAVTQTVSSAFGQGSQMAATVASFQRRSEDWGLQKDIATDDLEQLHYQLQSAQHNLDIAGNELKVLEKEITQNQKIATFYKQRFTNEQLFQWFIKELSTLYNQAYTLALGVAQQAELAWNYEQIGRKRTQALGFTSFINPGNWNSLFQGLLAGEGLMLDLHRMEKAFDDNNERRLEIEKTFALSLHNPEALAELKSKGSCTFDFMESDFALNYPGHYCRQIKSISVSIPMVIGPYQNIHATLTQNKYQIITSDDLHGQNAADQLMGIANTDTSSLLDSSDKTNLSGTNESLVTCCRANQQIALSKGINDTGLFEMNVNDTRYLPFEGTGAVSNWTLSIPRDNNNIDYDSLTDVIVRMEYTALPGQPAYEKHVIAQRAKIIVDGFSSLPLASLAGWKMFNNVDATKSTPLSIVIDPTQLKRNYSNFEITGLSIVVDLADGVSQGSDPLTLSLVAPDKDSSVKVSFAKTHTEITQGVILEGAWSTTNDTKPVANTPIPIQAEAGNWTLTAMALPDDIQNFTLVVEYTASPIAAKTPNLAS